MKVKIIQTNGEIKKCPKCNYEIFRKSKKSVYLNKEKTKGKTYELLICNKCGFRKEFNNIEWVIK